MPVNVNIATTPFNKNCVVYGNEIVEWDSLEWYRQIYFCVVHWCGASHKSDGEVVLRIFAKIIKNLSESGKALDKKQIILISGNSGAVGDRYGIDTKFVSKFILLSDIKNAGGAQIVDSNDNQLMEEEITNDQNSNTEEIDESLNGATGLAGVFKNNFNETLTTTSKMMDGVDKAADDAEIEIKKLNKNLEDKQDEINVMKKLINATEEKKKITMEDQKSRLNALEQEKDLWMTRWEEERYLSFNLNNKCDLMDSIMEVKCAVDKLGEYKAISKQITELQKRNHALTDANFKLDRNLKAYQDTIGEMKKQIEARKNAQTTDKPDEALDKGLNALETVAAGMQETIAFNKKEITDNLVAINSTQQKLVLIKIPDIYHMKAKVREAMKRLQDSAAGKQDDYIKKCNKLLNELTDIENSLQ
jgi:hypothetical protein